MILHPSAAVDFRRQPGTSRSMGAQRAFHEGQILFLRGDGAGAEARFHAALELDPALIAGREARKYKLSTSTMTTPEAVETIDTPTCSTPWPIAAMWEGCVRKVVTSCTRVVASLPRASWSQP